MSNNDDPIKEYKPFRLGLDNLEDNFGANTEYIDRELHNCSNDLSDKGSRREEIEHEKFAERTRTTNNTNTMSNSKENSGYELIIFYGIILIIIINIVSTICSVFF